MELTIFFTDDKNIKLYLSKDNAFLDKLIFPLDIHFDNMLVTSIDKILKKNRIEPASLKSVQVGGSIDQSSVACQVAKAVASALKSQ